MKDLYQKFKTPIIIIALLALAFIFYNMFFKAKVETSSLVSNPTANTVSADFLPLLLKIQDIKFDQGFFGQSTFTSLKDFSQKIIVEEKQRPDPFAPIAGVGNSSSTVESLGFTVQTVTDVSTTATSTSKSQATTKNK